MEYDKINNLLGSENENLSKFVTREYVRVNSLSNAYDENKSIRFKAPMLRSDLCDYADAYILVNGTIIVTANAGANKLVAVDLSKQKELDADPRAIQQIEFKYMLGTNPTIYWVLEKSKETILEFYKGTVKVY